MARLVHRLQAKRISFDIRLVSEGDITRVYEFPQRGGCYRLSFARDLSASGEVLDCCTSGKVMHFLAEMGRLYWSTEHVKLDIIGAATVAGHCLFFDRQKGRVSHPPISAMLDGQHAKSALGIHWLPTVYRESLLEDWEEWWETVQEAIATDAFTIGLGWFDN